MPIYEYGCGECGHVFEELIMSGESEPDECPACGHKEVGRLVSNTAFQLKGSGWYVTDYKGSKPSANESATAGGSSDSSSSGAGDSASSSEGAASSSGSDADPAA